MSTACILLLSAALSVGAHDRVKTEEQVFAGDRLQVDVSSVRKDGRLLVRLYERNHERHSLSSGWMSGTGVGLSVPFAKDELRLFAGKPVRLEFGTDGVRLDDYRFMSSDFPITEFGAKSDGQPCTAAFAAAIAAAVEAGGGRIVVPPGRWLSDVIDLRSECELRLERGSETVVRSVTAVGCTNVAIVGEGTLRSTAEADNGRRELVRFENRCFAVTLDDFKIRGTSRDAIGFDDCFYVNIRNLDFGEMAADGDGIVLTSTGNVFVERCQFDGGRDAVVATAGRDGRPRTHVSENIEVRECCARRMKSVFRIEKDGTNVFRNVRSRDCSLVSGR